MINTKFLTLTLESNGEVLELGNNEYKLLEVHGLEASDYDINITEHYSGIGGYVKKRRYNQEKYTLLLIVWIGILVKSKDKD